MMERNAQTRTLRTIAALVLALVGTLMLAALTPSRALAAQAVAYVYDASGSKVEYTSIHDAVDAGYDKTVYLEADIEVDSQIDIASDKKITIDMMGHVIKNVASNDRTFHVGQRANLTVMSSVTKEITFTGYGAGCTEKDVTLSTGGVICGANSRLMGSAFLVDYDSTLTLKNVTVGGNRDRGNNTPGNGGAAIGTYGGCTVNLEDNTYLTANYSYDSGGAIQVDEEYVDIVINHSYITDNFSRGNGGGIHSKWSSTTITMCNGAAIKNNTSMASGGGVAFDGAYFDLSGDGTTSISGNHAITAGGIEVTGRGFFSEGGTISGLKVSDNSSTYSSGGMRLDQNNVTVKNCTFTGNTVVDGNAGGIYVQAKNDTVQDCTVTGNTCGEEGGGIHVFYLYDLNVAGVLTVENNKRADGAKDDVFLDSSSSNATWAYLKGNLGAGSHVGIRTGVTGDRRLMKELSNYIEGTLFMDMDEYHLSYSSSDNELWQRTGEYDYLVTLNGKSVRRFTRGDSVTIDGSSDTAGQLFCRWDTDQSTGISGGISETDKYKELLSFTMPQNDVNLVGVYASPLTSADLRYFSKPVAGQTLPTFATFHWKNSTLSSGGTQQRDVSLTWYEVAADGTKTQASGVAKAGTTYVACFSIAPDPTMARVFSSSMADDAVTVYVNGGGTEKSASTSVDANTGVLTVTTAESTTEGDAPAGQGGTITVKLMDAGLSIEAGEQAMLLADANDVDEDLIGTLTVAYAEGSSSVTIAAPEKAGWNFCNWEKVAEGCTYDDGLGTVTVNDLDGISELTAAYTPVVTAAEVGLDAPVTGATLPTSLSTLSVSSSDGSTIDLVDEFSEDGTLPVLWSSGSSSVTAQASTTYTALIELADGEGLTDVEKVMSPNAVVTANGTEASSAGFVVLNSKLYLSVTFPETQGAKLSEVTQPDDIELSFDEAKACQEQQDKAGEDDLCWPLPKSCAITLEGGQTIACDVTWDVPTGFDANATSAQKLTATGTLSLPSYINANDVSLDVTCAINVAAPEGSDDKGDDEDDEHGKGDEKGDEDDTTKPDSKGDEKKPLPQAGDTNSTSTVVALGAAGVAVLVAALILRNRKK